MSGLRIAIICAVVLAGSTYLLSSPVHAASGGTFDGALADSLTRMTVGFYPAEPSVQDILDGLGYGLSAVTDQLSGETFCAPKGRVTVGVIGKYSGMAAETELLWYPTGSPQDAISILPGSARAGDSIVFFLPATESLGWNLRVPVRTSSFPETAFNAGLQAQARFYPTPDPETFLMFWEDLTTSTDSDFNDLVIWFRVEDPSPALSVSTVPTAGISPAVGTPVRFALTANADNCANRLTTIRMLEGEGTFAVVSGVGQVAAEHIFTPKSEGIYTFVFEAATEDIGRDVDTVSISVGGMPLAAVLLGPEISVTRDNRFTICRPETLCVPFAVSSTCELIDIRTEPPTHINIIDSTICYYAEAPIEFCVKLVAEDGCGQQDSVQVCFLVEANEPTTLNCPGVVEQTLCNPGFACFPINYSGGVPPVSITAVPPAVYNATNGTVCLLVEETGIYEARTVVQNALCPPETCVTELRVSINSPPRFTGIPDSTVIACGTGEFCFGPITCIDDENNINTCALWDGTGFFDGTTWCYTPNGFETVRAVFRSSDDCGRASWDTLTVQFVAGPLPVVTFADVSVQLCGPDTVCVPFSVDNPNNEPLTMSLPNGGILNLQDSTVCLPVNASGVYNLDLVAANNCGGADTATAQVTATLNTPPSVTCWPPVPDTVCIGDNICVGYTLADADGGNIQVDITGPGWSVPRQLSAGASDSICVAVVETGQQLITIVATDACGAADTCTVNLDTWVNSAPSVNVRDSVVFQCGPEPICIPYSCSDPDNNLLSCAATGSQLGTASGISYCFTPDTAGVYVVTVEATDACGLSASQQAYVTVVYNTPPVLQLVDSAIYDARGGDTVCFDFSVLDIDGNFDVVTASGAYISLSQNQICLVAAANQFVCATLIATDSCGATNERLVCVSAGPDPGPRPHLPDTVFARFCGEGDVCVPFSIDSSECGPVTLSALPGASLSIIDSLLCFTVSTPGIYETGLVASDTCAAETAVVIITAEANTAPSISCPAPHLQQFTICTDTTVCVLLPLTDTEFNIAGASASWGTTQNLSQNGVTVCLDVDTSGIYHSQVIVTDSCGAADTCNLYVNITRNRPPVFYAPNDTTIFLCAPEELCFLITCSDPDANMRSCDAVSLGDANWDGEAFCFVPIVPGDYEWVFYGEDLCGLSATDTFRVSVVFNRPPTIETSGDVVFESCGPESICVEYVVDDIDGGALTVTSDRGDVGNGFVCVYRDTSGTECLTIVVTDSCGLADSATVCITGTLPPPPVVVVPEVIDRWLCGPGEVCFDAQVSHDRGWSGTVTPVGAFNPADTSVCFQADTAGVYRIALTVTDSCGGTGADTALVRVTFNTPPTLDVPPDHVQKWCGPGIVCVEGITATDVDGNLKHLTKFFGGGTFDPLTGILCFQADTTGLFCFQFTAQDSCNAAIVKSLCVTLLPNSPPSVTITPPADNLLFEEPTQICFGVTATDPDDGQQRNLEMVSGYGTFTPQSANATIDAMHCFTADTTGCYEFVFSTTDSCGRYDYDTATVCVRIEPPDTMFQICVDSVESLNGVYTTVKVRGVQMMPMGGYDFLICYDPTVLNFSSAAPDSALFDWEYFTYRTGTGANCAPCGPGVLRLIGIFDMNNGIGPPPAESAIPKGPMFALTFYVTPDRNFLNQCAPLTFCTYDCGDNTISSPTGDTLYLATAGVSDTCFAGGKTVPIRRIEYCDGAICIIPPPDDRGDLNLNGIAHEVADGVLYTNFFIYGHSVWDPLYKDSQILASDVNCDGLVLTISDLVLLIRIITGDSPVQACPDGPAKPSPAMHAARITAERVPGALEFWVESGVDLGGVFVHLSSTAGFGDVTWNDDLGGLIPFDREEDGDLRTLLVIRQPGTSLPGGRHLLFRVPFDGGADWNVVDVQTSDANGALMTAEFAMVTSGLPQTFELQQNHPNPFNAGTQIRFSLAQPAAWELTVYNVLGQTVRRFAGTSEPGIVTLEWDATDDDGASVASGIYFSRLKAGEFTATRKMVLLK